MGWPALIRAALEGLASVKFFYEEIKKLNLEARLNALEANQSRMNSAVTAMAMAKTLEERDNALKDLANSHRP